MISERLYEAVKGFTDCGSWKHSWHWDRDRTKPWNPVTITGAKQMLNDLGCDGSESEEIEAAARRIRERYRLADELRGIIRKEEIRAEADCHHYGCRCDICKEAGYAK